MATQVAIARFTVDGVKGPAAAEKKLSSFFLSAIGTTSEAIRKPSGSDSETAAKPGIPALHNERNGLDRSANSSTSDR